MERIFSRSNYVSNHRCSVSFVNFRISCQIAIRRLVIGWPAARRGGDDGGALLTGWSRGCCKTFKASSFVSVGILDGTDKGFYMKFPRKKIFFIFPNIWISGAFWTIGNC